MSRAPAEITIRRALPSEAEALAALHVQVWRATYSAFAPAEALRQLDEARRLPFWTTAIAADPTTSGVSIATEGGQLLGVVSHAPASHPAFGPGIEITHLYVRPDAQGRGIGQRLLHSVLNARDARPPARVVLAVVRQNQAARGFYKAMGGTEIAEFRDPGPLWRSKNIVVEWDAA